MIGDGPQVALEGRLTDGDVVGDYEVLALAGAGGMGAGLPSQPAVSQPRRGVEADSGGHQPTARIPRPFHARGQARCFRRSPQRRKGLRRRRARRPPLSRDAMGGRAGSALDHRSHGQVGTERAAAIASQIASALDAVHGVAGLVHRDVKPANVLVRSVDGIDHAYLTDFGVAKPAEDSHGLTRTGSVVGTTGYLSPEQIRGQEPGPRSDLYALGCLFFEALTGSAPFTGENELAVRWAHANDPRPLASRAVPALGQRYDEFFMTALAVDPDQRFASGREFIEALQASQQGVAASATPLPGTGHAPTAIGPPLPPPAAGYAVHAAAGLPGIRLRHANPSACGERSGNPVALIVLGLIALAGIAVGALAAAASFPTHRGPPRSHA